MKIRNGLIKFAFILSFVAIPLAHGQTFMSEQEMLETLSGATLSGQSSYGNGDTRWVQVYEEFQQGKSQGVIKGEIGGKPYQSQWFIREGKWCENWGNGNGCYDLVLVDEKTIRAYEKGTPLNNLWEIQ